MAKSAYEKKIEKLLNQSKEDLDAKRVKRAESMKIVADELVSNRNSVAVYTKIKDLYPAPIEWNFFSKLPDDKIYELVKSIELEGLLNPIIIWKKDKTLLPSSLHPEDTLYTNFRGSKYMILSGHNRVFAYILLYNQTKDEKYLKIPAFIKTGITEEQARYYILVTNYVQRELTKKEKRLAILNMYRTFSNTTEKSIADQIASSTGMSVSSVYRYMLINQKLVDGFLQDYDEGRLDIKSAERLASKPKELQQYIYDYYGDMLNSKIISNIKPTMKTVESIEKYFNAVKKQENATQDFKYVEVKVSILKGTEKRFLENVKKFNKRNLEKMKWT